MKIKQTEKQKTYTTLMRILTSVLQFTQGLYRGFYPQLTSLLKSTCAKPSTRVLGFAKCKQTLSSTSILMSAVIMRKKIKVTKIDIFLAHLQTREH